jgi:geranylgeranyl diphosphate synthase type I
MKENKSSEEITEHLQKILHERGKEALELARKTVIEEEIESKEVQDALHYFMNKYWHDVTRPALLSLVCEAVGGDPKTTTPIGVSMTLISGGIDIHDDIVDQSKTKGPMPTVYGKFGQNISLLVGDALMFKGFTALYGAIRKGVPAQQIAEISDIIKKTFFELGDSEALELKFRNRTDLTPEEYMRVVRKKAADVEAYTRISAIVGGGSKEEIDALGEYGRLLGMLVILRDEMIDMLDFEETIHRLKKEHISLAIVYALQNPKMKSLISDIMKKATTTKDAEKLCLAVEEAGGFEQMHDCMQKLANCAYDNIKIAKHNKEYLALLIRGMLLHDWRDYLPQK